MKQRMTIAIGVTAGMLAAYGCSTSKEQQSLRTSSAPVGQAPQSLDRAMKNARGSAGDPASGKSQSSLDALRRGELPATPRDSGVKEVYFEFDRYDLDSEDRTILRANADWLKKNPSTRVEIEGHCDERGTTEYNLALGAKRAQAAKDYLISLGIAANRISTASYGEEIPVCREQNESCWQKNRRDRFVTLRTGPTS